MPSSLNGMVSKVLAGVGGIVISAAVLAAFGTYNSTTRTETVQAAFIKEMREFKNDIKKAHTEFDGRIRWLETGRGPP